MDICDTIKRKGGDNVTLETKAYIDAAVTLLAEGKCDVPVPIVGDSMRPFLCEGDTVYLNLPPEKLRVGDIALYKRPGERYTLHRVAKILSDGYEMLGDSQITRESVKTKIYAVATSAKIKGRTFSEKSLKWRFYKTVWLKAAPLRPAIARIRAFVKGA